MKTHRGVCYQSECGRKFLLIHPDGTSSTTCSSCCSTEHQIYWGSSHHVGFGCYIEIACCPTVSHFYLLLISILPSQFPLFCFLFYSSLVSTFGSPFSLMLLSCLPFCILFSCSRHLFCSHCLRRQEAAMFWTQAGFPTGGSMVGVATDVDPKEMENFNIRSYVVEQLLPMPTIQVVSQCRSCVVCPWGTEWWHNTTARWSNTKVRPILECGRSLPQWGRTPRCRAVGRTLQ